jgi:hypothetical protein
MDFKNILQAGETLKKWYFDLRNEPEAIEQLRRLILGVVTCLVIFYGCYSLVIEPMGKSLQKNIAKKQEMLSSVSSQYLNDMTPAIQQLLQERDKLKEQIAILELTKNLLREQWTIWGDANRFAAIILTLDPSSPVHIEDNLEQMTIEETLPSGSFNLHPVTLHGTALFPDFFEYIQYLEKQGEIGLIDNLEIKNLPQVKDGEQERVQFTLQVGRIDLDKTI